MLRPKLTTQAQGYKNVNHRLGSTLTTKTKKIALKHYAKSGGDCFRLGIGIRAK